MSSPFVLFTEHPVALTSRDHLVPGGTAMDDSGNEAFIKKAASLMHYPKRPFALLDLGCSSGRVVKEAIALGHMAAGLEGSDYSASRQRPHWDTHGEYLFCCDIAKPFTLASRHTKERTGLRLPFRFDVVTAWEVAEHIPEESLDQFCENALAHLIHDGLWVMSVSSQSGFHHMTVRGKDFWMGLFDRHGLFNDEGALAHFGRDVVRGLNEPSSFLLALRRKDHKVGA